MMEPTKEDIDLTYSYLVFQPNVKKGVVYTWADGSKVKKVYKMDEFIRFFINKDQTLMGNIQTICNTYSFYMISNTSSVVKKLDPSGKGSLYNDERNMFFTGTAKVVKEKKSIIDSLSSLGFDPVSDDDLNNLNISISNSDKESQGFMSRIMSILRKK